MDAPAFVRRSDVMALLGLSDWQIRKLEDAGTLVPVRLKGLGWKLYKKSDIERLAQGNGNKTGGDHEDYKTA